jgi:hypothetical protein
MDFEMPQQCILINGKKYQVYPHFLVKNSRYFENFFDDNICDVNIILPFKMGENEETLILNFLKIVSHIDTVLLYSENVSYYYEFAIYFGFTDIIKYCQHDLFKNSKLNFKKELQNNRTVLDAHLKLYYFNIDYLFFKTLYKYNKNLLCNYLNNDMLKINEQYIDIFKQCNKNKELHLHKLLKNNIRNNKKYYDLFLLNVFNHISPNLIKSIVDFKNKFNEITFGVLQKLSWDNIIIAGGATLICLLTRDIPYNEYSDIDIWVYGKTSLERNNKHKEILKYFELIFGDSLYFSVNYSVITIIVCGVKRNFQIILTNHKHKYQIIQRFDMDYVKCLYDGENVYGTVDFIEAINSNCASFAENDEMTPYNQKDFRLVKAYHKGFTINNNYAIDSEMKIELKYYYIVEKNVCDIENIHKIFKPQVVKSLLHNLINYENETYTIKCKSTKTIEIIVFNRYDSDEYSSITNEHTISPSNCDIKINNVLFFTYSSVHDTEDMENEKKYSEFILNNGNKCEYYRSKNSLIDLNSTELHINMNYVNIKQLQYLKTNQFFKTKLNFPSFYHTSPIDQYHTNKLDLTSQHNLIDLDIREEFKYFFPKIEQFENITIRIPKDTYIVDIFGNKLNKIPRMSMATIIVSLHDMDVKITKVNNKNIHVRHEKFLLCEKIIVYPPNYYTNMYFNRAPCPLSPR